MAGYAIEALWQGKKIIKDDYKIDPSTALILIIGMTVKERIINDFVDALIPHGGWLEFIFIVIREAIKIVLTLAIMAILAWALGIINSIISAIIYFLVKKFIDSVFKEVVGLLIEVVANLFI